MEWVQLDPGMYECFLCLEWHTLMHLSFGFDSYIISGYVSLTSFVYYCSVCPNVTVQQGDIVKVKVRAF